MVHGSHRKRFFETHYSSGWQSAIPRDVAQLLETAGLESPGWKVELLAEGGSLQSGFTQRLEYLDKLKVRRVPLYAVNPFRNMKNWS